MREIYDNCKKIYSSLDADVDILLKKTWYSNIMLTDNDNEFKLSYKHNNLLFTITDDLGILKTLTKLQSIIEQIKKYPNFVDDVKKDYIIYELTGKNNAGKGFFVICDLASQIINSLKLNDVEVTNTGLSKRVFLNLPQTFNTYSNVKDILTEPYEKQGVIELLGFVSNNGNSGIVFKVFVDKNTEHQNTLSKNENILDRIFNSLDYSNNSFSNSRLDIGFGKIDNYQGLLQKSDFKINILDDDIVFCDIKCFNDIEYFNGNRNINNVKDMTLEEIEKELSDKLLVEDGIEFIKSKYKSYTDIDARKPKLKDNHNVEDVIAYLSELEDFTKKYDIVDAKIEPDVYNKKLNKMLESFIYRKIRFESIVPQKYQNNVIMLSLDVDYYNFYKKLTNYMKVFLEN